MDEETISRVRALRYGRELHSAKAAQRTLDNLSPEDSCDTVGHKWRYRGTAPDGTVFHQCTSCRLWSES